MKGKPAAILSFYQSTAVAVAFMKWTARLSKTTDWVYRLGFPKGDVPYPYSGFIPLRQTRIGAQVAPRRCPILRCGKSNSIISHSLIL